MFVVVDYRENIDSSIPVMSLDFLHPNCPLEILGNLIVINFLNLVSSRIDAG